MELDEGYDALPQTFFKGVMLNISLDSPRLLIFSTSKATRVRLLPIWCSAAVGDPVVRVDIFSPHFEYHWDSLLSKMEESSAGWNIKPPKPCNLEPFNLRMTITINGETKTIIDRWANIVCKSSEFPKGLAHLLIQERNGKNVNKEVLHKLKKRKGPSNLRLEPPHEWGVEEQRSVVSKIWHSLDPKNATRTLCKPNQRPPILVPHPRSLDRSNPLAQYREAWAWVYGVLRFYTSHFATMKDHLGQVPQFIDEATAVEKLSSCTYTAVIVHFSKDGENLVCSWSDDGRVAHRVFASKSKTTSHPLTELPGFLIELMERNYKYFHSPAVGLTLSEVIQIFSLCLNHTATAPTTAVNSSPSLVSHCNLLHRFLSEQLQTGRSQVTLAQLEQSLNSIAEEHHIELFRQSTSDRVPVAHLVSPRGPPQGTQHQNMVHESQPMHSRYSPTMMNSHSHHLQDSSVMQQHFTPYTTQASVSHIQNSMPTRPYEFQPFQRRISSTVPGANLERQHSMDDVSHFGALRQGPPTPAQHSGELTRSGNYSLPPSAYHAQPEYHSNAPPMQTPYYDHTQPQPMGYGQHPNPRASIPSGITSPDLMPRNSSRSNRNSPSFFTGEDTNSPNSETSLPMTFAMENPGGENMSSTPDYGDPFSPSDQFAGSLFNGIMEANFLENLENSGPDGMDLTEFLQPRGKKRKLNPSFSPNY